MMPGCNRKGFRDGGQGIPRGADSMQILIIRLSSIGDVIHTLPAVGQIRRSCPHSVITWVAEQPGADLLMSCEWVDNVIVFPRRRSGVRGAIRNPVAAAAGVTAFLRTLRSQRYDLVIDFQGLAKSGVITLAARGDRKVGFSHAREGSRFAYHEAAPAPDFFDHGIERHMSMTGYLGMRDAAVRFPRFFTSSDRQAVSRLLSAEGIGAERPYVCVHPAARWPTKLWPIESAAALCAAITRTYGISVLLVGDQSQRSRSDDICSRAGSSVINVAGRTSLCELACLINGAALMVSMDSGPLHLACAVDTPTVGLFGPTDPRRTGPFGERSSVVHKALSCRPCLKKNRCPRGHYRCMRDITVEEVFQLCSNYLNSYK